MQQPAPIVETRQTALDGSDRALPYTTEKTGGAAGGDPGLSALENHQISGIKWQRISQDFQGQTDYLEVVSLSFSRNFYLTEWNLKCEAA